MDQDPLLVRYLGKKSRIAVLHILAETPDQSYTATEIADAARLDLSTVSKIWDDLVDDDLVEVEEPDDGPRQFQLGDNTACTQLAEFVDALAEWDADQNTQERDGLRDFKT